MSSAQSAKQNINTQLVLVGFAAMVIAFAFVAFITNMIVNSKVNAFAQSVSTQLSADQNNPVTVSSPSQSNVLGGCTSPTEEAAAATSAAAGTGAQANILPWNTKPGKYAFGFGNYSQSNSSVTNTTSNNTYVKDSYNTNTSTNVLVTNNGNTDNRNSGNTYTDSRNSNNTTNTTNDNSNNSVNVNVQDFSNNSVNNSNNNTNTTTNTAVTTNTDNSINTNVAAAIIL